MEVRMTSRFKGTVHTTLNNGDFLHFIIFTKWDFLGKVVNYQGLMLAGPGIALGKMSNSDNNNSGTWQAEKVQFATASDASAESGVLPPPLP
jgi:hypothetical protein